jgi:hypothetical protein
MFHLEIPRVHSEKKVSTSWTMAGQTTGVEKREMALNQQHTKKPGKEEI